MADLSLYRRADGFFDLFFDGNDLQTGGSLEGLVILSIGSDRRKAGSAFKKELQDDGWWGESTFEGDRWGSLLYTVFNNKNDSNVLLLAKQYVEDSLKWLVEDGVVGSVSADVSKDDEALYLSLLLSKDGVEQSFRYEFLWKEVA